MIDRLFLLNARRAEEEKLRGLAPAGAKQRPSAKKPALGAPRKPRPRPPVADDPQTALPLDEKDDPS